MIHVLSVKKLVYNGRTENYGVLHRCHWDDIVGRHELKEVDRVTKRTSDKTSLKFTSDFLLVQRPCRRFPIDYVRDIGQTNYNYNAITCSLLKKHQ